jgi:hypothetical protein
VDQNPPPVQLLAFAVIIAQKLENPFPMTSAICNPMRSELDAQPSESTIHMWECISIALHLTQLFRIIQSGDLPRSIIKGHFQRQALELRLQFGANDI